MPLYKHQHFLFQRPKHKRGADWMLLAGVLFAGYACSPNNTLEQSVSSNVTMEADAEVVDVQITKPNADADGNLEASLVFDGVERRYLVHFPQQGQENAKPALVVSLHGMGGNSRHDMGYQEWDKLADEEGFITVYPQGLEIPEALVGTKFPEAKTHWNAHMGTGVDDDGFLRKLVDVMVEEHGVDRSRVYVNGFSNGGIMSIKLACDMSDVFAAVGSVAGTGTLAHQQCSPSRPIPIIFFHGEKDTYVPINGQENRFISVQDTVSKFVELNQCGPAADSSEIADTHDDNTNATHYIYDKCLENASVEYIYIENGGHTWPGGEPYLPLGETSQEVDAKIMMWKFFQQFQLSE